MMPVRSKAPNPSLPLILVAHRSRDVVDVLRAILEHESFTVLCAYTGRAALQYARQHHPLLLFLDQELPLIDGLELCRILRRESDDPAIILLYDRPDEFGKILAFSAGADDCLELPFHPQELIARAKAVLRRIQRRSGPVQPLLRQGDLELDVDQRQLRVASEEVILRWTPLSRSCWRIHLAAAARGAGANAAKQERRVVSRGCSSLQAKRRTILRALAIRRCCNRVFASPT